MVFVCHVILRKYVIIELCNFMGRSHHPTKGILHALA